MLSCDENDPNGPLVLKRIEEVFVRWAYIINVHVRGKVIRTTREHPFFVRNKNAWVPAIKLEPGDVFRSHHGQWVTVEEVYDTGEYEKVYNFRVADFHTYFVGSSTEWGFSVWAHNQQYFHYTDENGANGMNSSRTIKASVSGYDKHEVKGKAVFLTTDPPDVVKDRGVKKYGLTKEKAQYVVSVDLPESQVKPVRGGRGEYVKYTTSDIKLPPKGKIGSPTGI